MTDTNSTDQQATPAPTQSVFQSYDHQATGLLDATFAETLGLSMHNAVNSQLNAQMSAATSITSACNRILQSGVSARPAQKSNNATSATPDSSIPATPRSEARQQVTSAPVSDSSGHANETTPSDTDSDAQRKEGLWNRLRQNNGTASTDTEQS